MTRTGSVTETGFEKMQKAIRRTRIDAVTEYYKFTRLGDTDLWDCSHPNEPDRTYRINLYDNTCTCSSYKPTTGCKHLSALAVHKHKLELTNKTEA